MIPISVLPPALLALISLTAPTHAFSWPFGQKRYTQEGLISAGNLGIAAGRIVGLGDWNGDQSLDIFTLSSDQKTVSLRLWDPKSYTYTDSSVNISLPRKIRNVVPGDFNYDGRLDLLVMSENDEGGWWTEAKELDLRVYLQDDAGHFNSEPIQLLPSSLAQPMVIDATGNLQPDLLALTLQGKKKTPTVKLWENREGSFSIQDSPLDLSKVCQISEPHSNAFVDLDGDCLADVFLHCTDSYSGLPSYQIWLNKGSEGFVLSKEGPLPKGSGMVTFADMNRDGSLDMVFPVCSSVSTTTGLGKDCSIYIAYNKQIPLCQPPSTFGGRGGSLSSEKGECRDPLNLCTSDPAFDFDLSQGSSSLLSLPLTTLLPSDPSPRLLLFDNTFSPSLPLPLKPGDYNFDGYPDLLLAVAPSPDSSVIKPLLLNNVPCSGQKDRKECAKLGEGGRTYQVVRKGAKVLDGLKDVRGVGWMDVGEDGSLDIVVHRTGKQDGQVVTFIKNNFFHDAFFLKSLVLNGACDGICTANDGSGFSSYGVSHSGASFKFTILDTSGRKTVSQVPQLPQTSYLSLQTPYSLFGLGRTNNYVENFFIGSTLHTSSLSPDRITSLEGLIPNSQIVITPPSSSNSSSSSTQQRSQDWSYELYLHPGEYVPWVSLSVVVSLGLLAVVVGWLHSRERREDERERRKAGVVFGAL